MARTDEELIEKAKKMIIENYYKELALLDDVHKDPELSCPAIKFATEFMMKHYIDQIEFLERKDD